MSDPRRAQHVATRVHEDLGPVTLLVNNAGMQIEKTVVDTADDDWERLVGVNCRGVFTMCRAVLPTMTVHGGVILNIGSISGVVADPGMATPLPLPVTRHLRGVTRSPATPPAGSVNPRTSRLPSRG